MDTRVSQLLHTLGGVYRDPNRIDRDSSYVLKSSVGKHLKPNIGELVMNNGTNFSTVLVLQGTIAMTFRTQTYQLLVDIYLPPQYPLRPPVCYVRLGPNMYLKENHPHVGRDGQVYMPYLHEWRQHSHNLVELVVAMSSLFSNQPPVFTKSPAAQEQERRQSSSQQSSPPPSYGQASTASSGRSNNNHQAELNAALEQSRKDEEERKERERLATILEQSRRDEEERQIRVKEDEERKAKAAQQEWDTKILTETKQKVSIKLQRHLLDVRNDIKNKITNDHRDKIMLENNTKNQLEKQLVSLEETKTTLEKQIKIVDEKTIDIKDWLKEEKINSSNTDKKDVSVDELCIPVSVVQKQMIDLSAENAAITDALYYLDKALIEHTIDIKTHLKQVRKLAKKQFLLRAHLIKISQYLQNGQGQSNFSNFR